MMRMHIRSQRNQRWRRLDEYAPDIGLARKFLRFELKTDLDTGLKRTYYW